MEASCQLLALPTAIHWLSLAATPKGMQACRPRPSQLLPSLLAAMTWSRRVPLLEVLPPTATQRPPPHLTSLNWVLQLPPPTLDSAQLGAPVVAKKELGSDRPAMRQLE